VLVLLQRRWRCNDTNGGMQLWGRPSLQLAAIATPTWSRLNDRVHKPSAIHARCSCCDCHNVLLLLRSVLLLLLLQSVVDVVLMLVSHSKRLLLDQQPFGRDTVPSSVLRRCPATVAGICAAPPSSWLASSRAHDEGGLLLLRFCGRLGQPLGGFHGSLAARATLRRHGVVLRCKERYATRGHWETGLNFCTMPFP
jgi:hypothetical protein